MRVRRLLIGAEKSEKDRLTETDTGEKGSIKVGLLLS